VNPAVEAGTDAKHLAAIDILQMGIEPAPAELASLAAVTQLAVHKERDDFGAAIDIDDEVMGPTCVQEARIAVPAAIAATVVQDDLDGVARRRLET
jgi:hypothetical protein